MKKHINQVRNNGINTEVYDEGQIFSDFVSPMKSTEHMNRLTFSNPSATENEISEKTMKIEEN